MAKIEPITLAEVLERISEKLDEAADFLGELEGAKKDPKRFTHRVSAFLSAAGSVIMMIEDHAKRYSMEIGERVEFIRWYNDKEDIFRTPKRTLKKTPRDKPVGTDRVWVYLRVARHDTIHIEQTNLDSLARLGIATRLHLSDGIRITELRPDGSSVIVVDQPPPPPPPPTPDEVHIEKDLWAFKQIQVIDENGNIVCTIDPPTDDVVSVCHAYMEKLRSLVDECASKLIEITPTITQD